MTSLKQVGQDQGLQTLLGCELRGLSGVGGRAWPSCSEGDPPQPRAPGSLSFDPLGSVFDLLLLLPDSSGQRDQNMPVSGSKPSEGPLPLWGANSSSLAEFSRPAAAQATEPCLYGLPSPRHPCCSILSLAWAASPSPPPPAQSFPPHSPRSLVLEASQSTTLHHPRPPPLWTITLEGRHTAQWLYSPEPGARAPNSELHVLELL